jgi:hypothetical protein
MDKTLIEVVATGEPVRIHCVVGPSPLKQIADKAVKVYRRSGLIKRLLKTKELKVVGPAAAKAEPAKGKPKGSPPKG